MKATEIYICPHCKAPHTTPMALAHCILACEEKQKENAEKQRKAELEQQKETRKKDIEDKEAELIKLKKQFFKDYGFYSSAKTYEAHDEEFPYLWHWILG